MEELTKHSSEIMEETVRAIRAEMAEIARLALPVSCTRCLIALTRFTVRLIVWSSIDQHELSMYEANFIAEVVDQIARVHGVCVCVMTE